MTFTPVGSITGGNAGSFSITPGAVGNLFTCVVNTDSNQTVYATALTATNITWTFVGFKLGQPGGGTSAIFTGRATSTSAASTTITWSGATPANQFFCYIQFSSTLGSWFVDSYGWIDQGGGSTLNAPSLTPTGSGDAYFCYALDHGTVTNGSTSGYTYGADGSGNGALYNANCTAATQSPTEGAGSAWFQGGALLVREGAPGTGLAKPPPGLLHPVLSAAIKQRRLGDATGPPLAAGKAPWCFVSALAGGSSGTRVYNVGANATNAGDTLLLSIAAGATTQTVSAVTDSKSNTWVLDSSFTGAVSPLEYAYRCDGDTGGSGGGPSASLGPGDTITVTCAAVSGNQSITGLAVPGGPWGPADVIGTMTAASNQVGPSTQSLTPSQDGELVIWLEVFQAQAGVVNIMAPWYAQTFTPSHIHTWSYGPLGVGTSGVAQNYTARWATQAHYRQTGWTFTAAPTTVTWPAAAAAGNTSAASGNLTIVPAAFTRSNNAEGGTNATAVTTGNAGGTGNDLFNTVSGTAITFDNTHIGHGSLAFKADYTTTGQNHLNWTGVPTSNRMYFRVELYFTTNPGAFGAYVLGMGAGSNQYGIRILSTGAITMGAGDHVSGHTVDVTTTAHIPLNQAFRIEGYGDNGACEIKLFNGVDDVSPAETQTKSSGAQNYLGTSVEWGGIVATTDGQSVTFWFDNVGLSNQGYIGPAGGSTTWAAGGSADNTGLDSAVGTVSLQMAFASTVVDSSTASGTVTLQMAGAGTASNASSASGAITATLAAAGTASVASTASGTITAIQAAAGTASGASSASGTVSLLMAAAGTASKVSSASGTFGPIAIAGAASNASTASGTVTATLTAAATAVTTSSAIGGFPIPVGGTASNASTASGVIVAVLAAAGTASTASTTSGTVALLMAIASTLVDTSSASGAITATYLPTASASNASVTSGTVTLLMAIASATVTVSSATGGLTYKNIAGTASGTSSASGTITLTGAIVGNAGSTSIASGTIVALLSMAGAAVSTSSATGAVTATLAVAGTASNASVVQGQFGAQPVGGTASSASAAAGTVSLIMAIAGTAVSPSSSTGVVTAVLAIAASASNASTASGTITATLVPAATAANVSTAQGQFGAQAANGTAVNSSAATGAVSLVMAVAGAATSSSNAIGTIVAVLAAAGTAIATSSASGTITATLDAKGTAPNVSAAQGVFGAQQITSGASNTSSASGTVTLILTAAGSAVTSSTASGAVTYKNIAGSAVTISSAQGAFGAQQAAGAASNTSVASGTITATLTISAAVSATSVTAGAFVSVLGPGGAAANASSATGALTQKWAVTASAVTTSSATGVFGQVFGVAGAATTTTVAQGQFGAQTLTGSAASASTAIGVLTTTLGVFGTAVNVSSTSGSIAYPGMTAQAVNVSLAVGSITAKLPLIATARNTTAADGFFGGQPTLKGTAVNVSVTYADTFVLSVLWAALELDVVPVVIGRLDVSAAVIAQLAMVPEVIDRLDTVPEVIDRLNTVPEVIERLDLEVL